MPPENQWIFFSSVYKGLKRAVEEGALNPDALDEKLREILADPYRWFMKTCKKPAFRPAHFDLEKPVILKQGQIEAPMVSVSIAFFNNEKYVNRAIESVLRQTYQNFEIICVDDGSTDNSLSIMMECAKKDPRITVVSQKNGGLGYARNTGIELAKGKYIQFLDSDDTLDEHTLEFMTALAEKYHTDISYFDGVTLYESEDLKRNFPGFANFYEFPIEIEEPVSGRYYFNLQLDKRKFRVQSCMCIFRRAFFDENNIRFQEWTFHQDNTFMLICLNAARRVNHTTRRFYKRTLRENSAVTGKKSIRHFYGYFECVLKSLERLKTSEDPVFNDHIISNMNGIISTLKRYHTQYSEKGTLKDMFTGYEWSLYNQFVITSLNERGNGRKEMNNELTDKNAEISRLRQQLDESEKSLAGKNNEIDKLKRRLAESERKISDTKKAIESVHASDSYRLGNRLLAPFSKLKTSFKK